MRIIRLSGHEDDAIFDSIEAIHRTQLTAGALAHMPRGFLHGFYRFLSKEANSAVFVSVVDGRVTGFVTGTSEAHDLLQRLAVSRPIWCAGYGLRLLLRPVLFMRAVNIAWQSRGGGLVVDRNQLLSIAVDSEAVRSGTGRELFSQLSAWFLERGTGSFDIVASTTQKAALLFYGQLGAHPTQMAELGGLKTVIYRYDVKPNSAQQS